MKDIIASDKITNVELTLLQIIGEKKEVSGYEINRIVLARGYRDWANIGTTSIYKGLEKLGNKQLVTSSLSNCKTGKGPIPRLFQLNKEGYRTLIDTIILALSNTTERDHRFDLGLAGLGFIKSKNAMLALKKRKTSLKKRRSIIKAKFKNDQKMDIPFSAILVFEHPLLLIENEIRFIDSIIKQINERKKS